MSGAGSTDEAKHGDRSNYDPSDLESTGEPGAELDTPGFDRPAVEAWIEENIDQLRPPLQWTQLTGGHSNLTYRLTDATGGRAVIRRAPVGDLLPKAHDMNREFTVLSALAGTAVPVPQVYGRCQDTGVTGSVFYLMSEVEGRVLYTARDVEDYLGMAERRVVGPSFITTLAALHSLDPTGIGLQELGRPDHYLSRQLRVWYGSWQASIQGADYDDQRIHRLHRQLSDSIPPQPSARVVHGDYGMHNCMVGSNGAITAVLDWEIATLGDPLADFAYALNGWSDPDDTVFISHESATTAEGFHRRAELIDHYRELIGLDLGPLRYYRGFNYFKTACILHGVYARYRLGIKDSGDVDLDALHQRMVAAIDLAVQQLS